MKTFTNTGRVGRLLLAVRTAALTGCIVVLTTLGMKAEAEFALELNFDPEFNAYSWQFLPFGPQEFVSAESPGGTLDFGFFGDFQSLADDVAGSWTLTTNVGVATFDLDPISENDFIVPVVTSPIAGQTFESGEFIPFLATAPGSDFISRGFVNNDDLTGSFPIGGFSAVLNPGVQSAEFRVFALGAVGTQATNVSDPDDVFDDQVTFFGSSETISLTITAVPEPSTFALASLCVGLGLVRRRRR
ncbi:MAG: PEP-CTERM sorting domain-containing protein [Planctomycetota bacterium]